MNKILIPTDFSDISKNAAIYGFQLAEQINAEIELLHILEIYKFAAGTSEAELISTILPAENIAEMEETAKNSFDFFIETIKNTQPIRVPYQTKVVTGHLVNELIVQSSMPETKLIILSVSSNQDLATRFTHNTISAILSESTCPIMVLPSNCTYKPILKVVFATDFKEEELNMLKKFLSLFINFNPTITVLHVTNKSIDFKTKLLMAGMFNTLSEETGYKHFSSKTLYCKNLVQGIIEQSKEADLLLMLKEHEGFFKSLFEVSKTEKITHYLTIPMLSYRSEKIIKK